MKIDKIQTHIALGVGEHSVTFRNITILWRPALKNEFTICDANSGIVLWRGSELEFEEMIGKVG